MQLSWKTLNTLQSYWFQGNYSLLTALKPEFPILTSLVHAVFCSFAKHIANAATGAWQNFPAVHWLTSASGKVHAFKTVPLHLSMLWTAKSCLQCPFCLNFNYYFLKSLFYVKKAVLCWGLWNGQLNYYFCRSKILFSNHAKTMKQHL